MNGAGALYDFGCYGADLMTWLMDGQRPTSVTAVTQHIKPEIYTHVDDEATIILTYPKAQAILQPSWNWPFDRKDMEVYGQTGYVITVRHDDVRVRLKGEEQEKLVAAKPVPPPSDDSIICCGQWFWAERRRTRLLLWRRMLSSPRFSMPPGVPRLPGKPFRWPPTEARTESATISCARRERPARAGAAMSRSFVSVFRFLPLGRKISRFLHERDARAYIELSAVRIA